LPDTQSTWVNTFDDYVDDFTFFATSVPTSVKSLPLFLVAASMGGLISAIAISRIPHLINRAVLLAPMFRNKCGMKCFNYQWPIPQPLAYWLAQISCYFGGGKMHCIGYFNENPDRNMPLNVTTSSQEQLHIWNTIRRENPMVLSTCVTNDWLYHSLRAQRKFETRHPFIHTNTLIVCAEHDYFVYNRAISHFAQHVPNSKVLFAPSSYHEVWAEKDTIRGATLKAICDFFSQKSDDVLLVEPSTPLIVYDHTQPTYSVWEATFRSSGILLATLGVVIGLSMVIGDTKKK
jgi:alpha-beta hydrolase superfamily lysophospholipase